MDMNSQNRQEILNEMKEHECLYCKHKLDCKKRDEAIVLFGQYKEQREKLDLDWTRCQYAQFYVNWRSPSFEQVIKVGDDIYFQYDMDSSLAIGFAHVIYLVPIDRFKEDKPEY